MNKLSVTLPLLVAFLMSGCAQKIRVKALEPAEIMAATSTKKVAVAPFTNDSVNFSSKLESSISKQAIDGKPYFTVINRTDFNKIIKEQKIQSSGLLNQNTAVKVGNLLGAQAIISGSVDNPTSSDNYYSEGRTKCTGKGDARKCYDYTVSCQKRTVGLSAQIRMINVSTAEVIYADNISRQDNWSHCSDDSNALPSKEAAVQKFADTMTNDFSHKLTPHYVYQIVTFLDESDLKYNSEQDDLLENALLYFKQSRDDKAEELLKKLLDSTNSKSYVPFYNLGVIYESQGKYHEAREYYNAADKLATTPVEEINEAVTRIKSVIEKHKIALEQISKK